MLTDAHSSTVNRDFLPEGIQFHHKCIVDTKMHDFVMTSMLDILSSFKLMSTNGDSPYVILI